MVNFIMKPKHDLKKIPVLFLIFCREDITLESLASIKAYKPDKLYIAADGPRTEKPDEFELCENTRKSVLNAIDWDCEIQTLFRAENQGCAKAVSSAISWFFSYEESGIIIEDDCVIHPDFYRLCEILLPLYINEEKIMLIAAQNMTPEPERADQLAFSNGCYIWGWASWRRAWNKMDMNMTQWPQYKFRDLVKNYGFVYGIFMLYYWHVAYKTNTGNSWAIRWWFSVLVNRGLCLSANVSLSKNTGIEIGGANYEKGDKNPYTHIPFGSIKWPIQISERIELTKKKILAERKEFIRIRKIGLKKKIKNFIK